MTHPSGRLTRCDSGTEGCLVCRDEAVVGRVLQVDAASRTAVVEFSTGSETVAMDLVDGNVGDVILVHLGFAIERLERGVR